MLRIASFNKKINTQYEIIEFHNSCCHTFFGYYDLSPFQGENIAYLELKKNSNICKIVLNDIYNSSKQYITESYAWNWQQGTRLRWFPKSDNIISFNDYREGRYINRIIDIKTKDEKRIDWPLYDIDSSGKYGVTLDFGRLGVKRPGYGYNCEEYKEGDLWCDGISIIDIESNKLVKKITYKELSDNIKKVDNVSNFYINHLSFSPDGTKFLFFWIDEQNGFHQASLGVYDIPNGELIPLEVEGKASHYVWDGNNDIICTVLNRSYFARYYRYNIADRSRTLLCSSCLQADGHPSIYDNNTILTDTYPDTRGFQHIYFVNETADNKTELVKIYSVPILSAEKRTDLHPRISPNKDIISFDSNYAGCRRMLLLKINNHK